MIEIYITKEEKVTMESQGEVFMNTEEAALYTGISKSTLQKEYKDYKGKTPRITRYYVRCKVYYLKKDLDILKTKVRTKS